VSYTKLKKNHTCV